MTQPLVVDQGGELLADAAVGGRIVAKRVDGSFDLAEASDLSGGVGVAGELLFQLLELGAGRLSLAGGLLGGLQAVPGRRQPTLGPDKLEELLGEALPIGVVLGDDAVKL